MSLVDLTKIYDSRSFDVYSRSDRASAKYNRRELLFNKFLAMRKPSEKLQLTHEHILDIGNRSIKNYEVNFKQESPRNEVDTVRIQTEINRIENDVEQFKQELISTFQKKFEKEKLLMKRNYENLMERIEKQRDEIEEERVKEIIRKMNDECEEALKRQWNESERIRKQTLLDLKDLIRQEVHDEKEKVKYEAIRMALENSEINFKRREKEAIETTKQKCESEASEKIKQLCEKYDQSIERLLLKIKNLEESLTIEKSQKNKLQEDFRLLQTDYKRFMNYTDHYHSDYMMKLRHIGNQLIEDKEFEQKLNEKIELIDLRKLKSNSARNKY